MQVSSPGPAGKCLSRYQAPHPRTGIVLFLFLCGHCLIVLCVYSAETTWKEVMDDTDAGNDFCVWLKEGADDVQTSTKRSGMVHDAGGEWLTPNFEVVNCILRRSCVCS